MLRPMLASCCRKMGTAKNTVKHRIFWWPVAYLGAMLAHLGAMLAYFEGNVGPSWGYVGPSWGLWSYVGPSWGYVAHLGGYVGPCWPILRPMLGCPILSNKGRKMDKNGKSTKHRKTRHFLAGGRSTQRSAAGAAAPLSYGKERNGGPWPEFKRLRATAGQGPNYVGPSCGYMLAYVGLMLTMWSQKIRKIGTAKKRCKTQDILMVGGPSWGYLGLCWPILRAMLSHLGGYVGPCWGYVGPSWGLCWPMLTHLEPQDPKTWGSGYCPGGSGLVGRRSVAVECAPAFVVGCGVGVLWRRFVPWGSGLVGRCSMAV